MRTFIIRTAIVAVLSSLLIACVTDPGEPNPVPPTKPQPQLVAPKAITCAEGDTVPVKAYATPEAVYTQPVALLAKNAAVAAVIDTNTICRKAGGADIEVRWTDGVNRLTDTIKVTVTAPTHRIITVRTGYVPSDLFKNPLGLRVVVSWRFPSRDSVVGTIDAEGVATFSVPREIADVMDSVMVSVSGSAFHHAVKYRFRRIAYTGYYMSADAAFAAMADLPGSYFGTPLNNPSFKFVLSPKSYTVPLGRYVGQVVQVSIENLYKEGPSHSPWMLVPGTPVEAGKVLTICFDRAKSNIPITAFDSTAWANGLRDSAHSAVGVQRFQFGTTNCDRVWVADSTFSSYSANTKGIYVHQTPAQLAQRFGTELALREAAFVATHEAFFHSSGVGHTNAWVGVMNAAGTSWVTLMDAAMFLLPWEMNLVAYQMGGALGLEAANEALK